MSISDDSLLQLGLRATLSFFARRTDERHEYLAIARCRRGRIGRSDRRRVRVTAGATLAASEPETSVSRENIRVVPPPERAQLLVYVAGAVVHPGVYALASDARARDALAKAGGATHDADLVAVNLAAHVADGDELAVPRQGEARSAAVSANAAQPLIVRRRGGPAVARGPLPPRKRST